MEPSPPPSEEPPAAGPDEGYGVTSESNTAKYDSDRRVGLNNPLYDTISIRPMCAPGGIARL